MKYECPTCNDLDRDLERAYVERDAIRAALAEVEAERDRAEERWAEWFHRGTEAEARLVPVVELINGWWDKPGSLTYDEAFTAVEAALSVTAGVEQVCPRNNDVCDYPATTPAEVDP